MAVALFLVTLFCLGNAQTTYNCNDVNTDCNKVFVFTETQNNVEMNCVGATDCASLIIYSAIEQLIINCKGDDSCNNINVYCGHFEPLHSIYSITDMDRDGLSSKASCSIFCDSTVGRSCNNVFLRCKGDDIINNCLLESKLTNNVQTSTVECDTINATFCGLDCRAICIQTDLLCHTGSICDCKNCNDPQTTVTTISDVTYSPTTAITTSTINTNSPTITPTAATTTSTSMIFDSTTTIISDSITTDSMTTASDGEKANVDDNKKDMDTLTLVLIIIGLCVVIIIIACIIFFFCCKKRNKGTSSVEKVKSVNCSVEMDEGVLSRTFGTKSKNGGKDGFGDTKETENIILNESDDDNANNFEKLKEKQIKVTNKESVREENDLFDDDDDDDDESLNEMYIKSHKTTPQRASKPNNNSDDSSDDNVDAMYDKNLSTKTRGGF